MENITAGEAPVLNPNDAPDGYVAVLSTNYCEDCALIGKDCAEDETVRCTAGARQDKRDVIFIKAKKSTSAPATLLHPMGSMGEEVAA